MGLSRRRTDRAGPKEAGVDGGQRLEELLPPLAEGGAEGGEIEKVNAVALRQRWTIRELAGMQAEDPLLGRVQQLLKDRKERRPRWRFKDFKCLSRGETTHDNLIKSLSNFAYGKLPKSAAEILSSRLIAVRKETFVPSPSVKHSAVWLQEQLSSLAERICILLFADPTRRLYTLRLGTHPSSRPSAAQPQC